MSQRNYKIDRNSIKIRNPDINDGAKIWGLIHESKPLDPNSSYLYLLLCQHFSNTCLVADCDARLLGFVSAYFPPKLRNVIFIWQIAVHKSARGHGLAKDLLHKLLQRDECKGIKFIETTVSPSNEASKKLFRSFARDLNVECQQMAFFPKNIFPPEENHEEENLFRLGPLH